MKPTEIAPYVDYTLLRPDATAADIDDLCRAATSAQFAAVCVNGIWVDRARRALVHSGVAVATVVAFPLGADPMSVKEAQTRDLVGRGADEIDMVLSLGHLIGGQLAYVTDEIGTVVRAAEGRVVKVILETAALDRSQIEAGVEAARAAQASFVKTSTGMHPKGGATEETVALLARLVGGELGVKASGGVRSLEAAERMIAAGATRIGTSSNLTANA